MSRIPIMNFGKVFRVLGVNIFAAVSSIVNAKQI